MDQPRSLFVFLHHGEGKALRSKVGRKNFPGGADGQAERSRAGNQLGSERGEHASPRKNRQISALQCRTRSCWCPKVNILKQKGGAVHYEEGDLHEVTANRA